MFLLSWMLSLTFFVLKLTDVLDTWDWFWVFSPLVFVYGFSLVVIVVTAFMAPSVLEKAVAAKAVKNTRR